MKYLIFIFLLASFLQGATSIKRDVIIKAHISNGDNKYISSKKIKLSKQLYTTPSVKLKINKELLKRRKFYLHIICDVDDLSFSNTTYSSNFDSLMVPLDENSPEELLFKFKYKEPKNLNFRVFVLNEFERQYIIQNQGLIYGIAYGVMFCAFLYNFVIFIYTRQRSFLYYSLMQLSLMVILLFITILDTQTFTTTSQQIFIDFLETFCVLLTILFSKEILNTKKSMPFIDKILSFLVYINIVDLIFIFIFNQSLLYEYLPRTLVLSLLVLSGVIALFKGQKSAIFYFFGWVVLFISLLIAEHELLEIDDTYIIHIGFPLESLILSFALGYKLKQTVDEKEQKEKILVHQSKLASMGEMINNIAHQWRQPLTHLSFINMDLQMAQEQDELSKQYLKDKLDESNNQIEFMSNTIDDFKNFYEPVKEKEFFYASSAIKKALDIIKPTLDFLSIEVELNIQEDKKIRAYENEYSQVILNLLTNAKDAIVQNKIESGEIQIDILVSNKKSIVSICDNAGGIKEEIIEKIFDPYFTTKDKSSGIGLYMSKIIIHSHFKGDLKVINLSKGACFTVEV